MRKYLRLLFFVLIVKPLVFVLLGVNTYHRGRLPRRGPAIIIANHNSHLDTVILMSLFPIAQLPFIRPVAAADYFLSNRWLAWFSKAILGIIPIVRKGVEDIDPLQPVHDAIQKDAIVIFYPEGTRGEPNHLAKIKSGIAYLASQHPSVEVIPIFINGTGKALPKGEALLVPFIVDIHVHKPIRWTGDKDAFIHEIEVIFTQEEHKILEKNYA